jgi:hypothetical protein
MAKTTITLADMLQEMGTWISTPIEKMEKAKASGITNKNNKNLKSLITAWEDGNYDEDPDLLHQALTHLIPA